MVDRFHKANRWPLGEWLVGEVLMRPALRRAFGGVYASVHPAALRAGRDKTTPLIFCATHSGWWDGHMAFILDRQIFHRPPYVMMEERQLSRYSFFTWVGAFSVVKEDPRSALASISYITDTLSSEPASSLWMFPQGEMAYPDARPLHLFGGAAHIARRLERCALVPVALRYSFLSDQAPVALARVGEPILAGGSSSFHSKELTNLLGKRLTTEADALRDALYSYPTANRDTEISVLKGYRRILKGRGSVNSNWDSVRLLAKKAVRGSDRA